MTRSFTSMLIGLQYLAACQAEDRSFANSLIESLNRLPAMAERVMNTANPAIRDFVAANQFGRLRLPGAGPILRRGV